MEPCKECDTPTGDRLYLTPYCAVCLQKLMDIMRLKFEASDRRDYHPDELGGMIPCGHYDCGNPECMEVIDRDNWASEWDRKMNS